MRTSTVSTILVLCVVLGFGVVPAIQLPVRAAESAVPRPGQPATTDYRFLASLKLPWQRGDTEPRLLTQDWQDHNVVGFALDFGHAQGGVYLQDTVLLAPMSGTVTTGTDPGTGYGHWVKIDAGNGWQVLLAHLASPSLLPNGARVRTGQVVGYVGNSGNVPVHIHVEVRLHDAMPDVTRIERIFGRLRDDFRYPSPELWTSTNTNPYRCTGDGIYVYEHVQYDPAGRCVKLTSSHPAFSAIMSNDMAASVRFVGSYAAGWELMLYEHEHYTKHGDISSTLRTDDPDLQNDAIGNGRASSAQIRPVPPPAGQASHGAARHSGSALGMYVAE